MGRIKAALKKFIGQIQQTPPTYAAIKVKGKKLYEYARQGKEVEIKPREVTVHAIELLEYTYPILTIRTTVSAGTYIRALARDIGKELKTGAYVSALRRTAIGKFTIQDSVKISAITSQNWPTHLHNPKDLISHIPQITLDNTSVAKLQQGREVDTDSQIVSLPAGQARLSDGQSVAILNQNSQLIGIATYQKETNTLSPRTIFPY